VSIIFYSAESRASTTAMCPIPKDPEKRERKEEIKGEGREIRREWYHVYKIR